MCVPSVVGEARYWAEAAHDALYRQKYLLRRQLQDFEDVHQLVR